MMKVRQAKIPNLRPIGGPRRVRWADSAPTEERAVLARFRGESDDGPVKVSPSPPNLSADQQVKCAPTSGPRCYSKML